MNADKRIWLALCGLLITSFSYAQNDSGFSEKSNTGMFSLGWRSTVSLFDHDGTGHGTGGQFRIQLTDRVNTDWYADYITINMSEGVRSTYYHIGWSVLFYLRDNASYPKLIQPYVLAGHCFDYNEKTVIESPSISESRWGSAVQAGVGTHFNLSDRFDLSLTSQYMIHLTKELEVEAHGHEEIEIHQHSNSVLEGHMLTTFSVNYKLFRIWTK
jgi:hypothetical protein